MRPAPTNPTVPIQPTLIPRMDGTKHLAHPKLLGIPSSHLKVVTPGSEGNDPDVVTIEVSKGVHWATRFSWLEKLIMGINLKDFKDTPLTNFARLATKLNELAERFWKIASAAVPALVGRVEWENPLFMSWNRVIRTETPKDKTTFALRNAAQPYSLLLTPNGTKYIYFKRILFRGSKVIRHALEVERNELFLRAKPNKAQAQNFGVFDNEVNVYRKILEESKKGTDLTGILVPKEIVEYDKPSRKKHVVEIILPAKESALVDQINKRAIPKQKHLSLSLKIVLAIIRYHEVLGIYHRDLKPDNILLQGDDVFLIDHGFASSEIDTVNTTHFTDGYIPPEMLSGKANVAKMEVWTTGLVLLILALEGVPNFMTQQMNGNWPNFSRQLSAFQFEHLDSPIADIIKSMLLTDPHKRPTLQQVADDIRRRLNRV